MATSIATPVTYLSLISQDEKKLKQGELGIQAQGAYIAVQTEVMKLKQGIIALNNQLETAKRAIPYNLQTEFKVTQNLETENGRLAFAEKILKDRFADISA